MNVNCLQIWFEEGGVQSWKEIHRNAIVEDGCFILELSSEHGHAILTLQAEVTLEKLVVAARANLLEQPEDWRNVCQQMRRVFWAGMEPGQLGSGADDFNTYHTHGFTARLAEDPLEFVHTEEESWLELVDWDN